MLREMDFVHAAKALGAGHRRIVGRGRRQGKRGLVTVGAPTATGRFRVDEQSVGGQEAPRAVRAHAAKVGVAIRFHVEDSVRPRTEEEQMFYISNLTKNFNL